MADTKILSERFVGPNLRYRITKFATRFGTIEYFGFDAGDITDADIAAGHSIEPFAQGTYRAVMAAIRNRRAKERRALGLRSIA